MCIVVRAGAPALPLSPCGRGCLSEAKAGEGFLSAGPNPSSGTDCVHATFSHKGRRKEVARQPARAAFLRYARCTAQVQPGGCASISFDAISLAGAAVD